MSWTKIWTSEIRIGVTGLYASGKTVFLTSLLNHLQHHDPDAFRLGDGSVILRKFRRLAAEPGWQEFNYTGYRDAFAHKRWPRKTTDSSQYVCSFERSDWRLHDLRLLFYDLPGERIADAVMLAKDYAGWSDHVLHMLQNDTPYRKLASEFLSCVDHPEASAEQILLSYKFSLGRLIHACKPYVSPSLYLVNQQGQNNRQGKPPEQMVEGFYAGLGVGQEFAPLPADTRSRRPDLADAFEDHYDAYREEIVRPLILALRSCHALIVLVDVTMLLAGGVGMYDDNRQILLDLLDVLSPGQSPLGRLYRGLAGYLLPASLRPGGITRIAFVAPKLDQVHPQDRDHMTELLRRMLERPAMDRDGLDSFFTNCSAVYSADQLPDEKGQRWLRGVPLFDQTGRRNLSSDVQKFTVSALPQDWPGNWPPPTFHFPDVYPEIPPRKDRPPRQINLDKILDFVVG